MMARLIHHPNANFQVMDCFGEEFAKILRETIATSRGVLLLCDGGDKPRELAYFRNFLRPGDMIMAHDYQDEVQDADLECLAAHWTEIEPERYRAALLPFFQRRI
jgi:hypothetical protein